MELADNVTSADLSTELGWLVVGRGTWKAKMVFACHTPLGGSELEERYIGRHHERRLSSSAGHWRLGSALWDREIMIQFTVIFISMIRSEMISHAPETGAVKCLGVVFVFHSWLVQGNTGGGKGLQAAFSISAAWAQQELVACPRPRVSYCKRVVLRGKPCSSRRCWEHSFPIDFSRIIIMQSVR